MGHKKVSSDSLLGDYYSKVNTPGTIDNYISQDSTGSTYTAFIECCLSKRNAKQVVKGWEKELSDILGSFKRTERRSNNGFRAADFSLEHDQVQVTLTYFINQGFTTYGVGIHISYYSYLP